MSKLLTVVTSTYNKGNRNRASIQSILDQTLTDFEYIIINDGSPDNTKEILEEFNDPRLKIIHQGNKGFTKTMVSVMEQIKTPYVAIQGAGDISLEKRLEKQLKFLESRPDVGVVSCDVDSILYSDFSRVKKSDSITKAKKQKVVEYNSVDQMIKSNIVDHGDAMIRMSAYHEAGGYRPFFRYVQDRDLWLRILENYSIVKLPEKLYIKIVDSKFDISGNPKKSEEQALYSLFGRYLAHRKMIDGKDLLDENGESEFLKFTQSIGSSEKEEIVGRVFRNTLKDPNAADNSIEIIKKYIPEHQYIDSLKTLSYLNKKIPYGGDIYKIYYFQYLVKLNKVKKRLKNIFS